MTPLHPMNRLSNRDLIDRMSLTSRVVASTDLTFAVNEFKGLYGLGDATFEKVTTSLRHVYDHRKFYQSQLTSQIKQRRHMGYAAMLLSAVGVTLVTISLLAMIIGQAQPQALVSVVEYLPSNGIEIYFSIFVGTGIFSVAMVITVLLLRHSKENLKYARNVLEMEGLLYQLMTKLEALTIEQNTSPQRITNTPPQTPSSPSSEPHKNAVEYILQEPQSSMDILANHHTIDTLLCNLKGLKKLPKPTIDGDFLEWERAFGEKKEELGKELLKQIDQHLVYLDRERTPEGMVLPKVTSCRFGAPKAPKLTEWSTPQEKICAKVCAQKLIKRAELIAEGLNWKTLYSWYTGEEIPQISSPVKQDPVQRVRVAAHNRRNLIGKALSAIDRGKQLHTLWGHKRSLHSIVKNLLQVKLRQIGHSLAPGNENGPVFTIQNMPFNGSMLQLVQNNPTNNEDSSSSAEWGESDVSEN